MHKHDDIDWSALAGNLVREGEIQLPHVRQALAELDRAPATVLDIGSGPGVTACLIAQTYPDALVTAVDGTRELLDHAEHRAKDLGVDLRTRHTEFPDGLTDLPTADLIWSSQVVHHVGDQQDTLTKLAALLTPGGTLAIVEGGLPTRFLPRDIGIGEPGLHPRLDAAVSAAFTTMRAELPGTVSVVEDWPAMLRAAGLVDVRSKTFLVDLPAPLDAAPRAWVRDTLERVRHRFADTLSDTDKDTIDRLIDPADPASVDTRPDLFLLTAKTVHYGRRG